MSVAEIKQRLHTAIEEIENEEFLKAILTIIGEQNKQGATLTEKQWQILKEREARYRSGESKPVPFEEVQAQMKKKYGF
jgi:PHD/YefM family antitoxin component YafN of YafNO toxin-antitoxin module